MKALTLTPLLIGVLIVSSPSKSSEMEKGEKFECPTHFEWTQVKEKSQMSNRELTFWRTELKDGWRRPLPTYLSYLSFEQAKHPELTFKEGKIEHNEKFGTVLKCYYSADGSSGRTMIFRSVLYTPEQCKFHADPTPHFMCSKK